MLNQGPLTARDVREASDSPRVWIRRLPHGMGLELPTYQTPGAAGADLIAAIPPGRGIGIENGERVTIPCGFEIVIPDGYAGLLCPRSGLAIRHGITLGNAPGVLDPDYRGEVMCLLINQGGQRFTVYRGSRVAQLLIVPVQQAIFVETEEVLPATERGANGFGSTGGFEAHESRDAGRSGSGF